MSDICPGYVSLWVCQGDLSLQPVRSFFRVSDIVSFKVFFPKDSAYMNANSIVSIEECGDILTHIVEDTVDSIAKKIIESKYCEQVGLQRVEL